MALSPTHAPARERLAGGKAVRDRVSRSAQADPRARERNFDPIEVLVAAGAGRVARLLPIKYARMKVSPFAFFRGAVSIMAADLGRLPHSGIGVQLCGDAHVQNMGSFSAPDGSLVFDLNDFDETIAGPWEWDLKRMATSIVLAGDESGHNRASSKAAAEACCQSYCRFIGQFSTLPFLEVERQQVHRADRIAPVHAALKQSERARPLDLLARFTGRAAKGAPRFRDLRPSFWRVAGKPAREVLDSLPRYRDILSPERRFLFDRYRPVDVAFKVVGTGSVGMRDYVVLLQGNGPKDPVFLQIKQEMASAYAPYLPAPREQHHGRRVAEGQRAVQPRWDALLGWTTIGPHHFLVRQLNDRKGSIDLRQLRNDGLSSLAVVAGELLARGHARSGDPCLIRGYCGSGTKMARIVRDFAVRYADQTGSDYAAFLKCIKKGSIRVAPAA